MVGQRPSEDHLAILPFSQELEEDRDDEPEDERMGEQLQLQQADAAVQRQQQAAANSMLGTATPD